MPKPEGLPAAPCTNRLISGCFSIVLLLFQRRRRRYFQKVFLVWEGEVQVKPKMFFPSKAESPYDLLSFGCFVPYQSGFLLLIIPRRVFSVSSKTIY